MVGRKSGVGSVYVAPMSFAAVALFVKCHLLVLINSSGKNFNTLRTALWGRQEVESLLETAQTLLNVRASPTRGRAVMQTFQARCGLQTRSDEIYLVLYFFFTWYTPGPVIDFLPLFFWIHLFSVVHRRSIRHADFSISWLDFKNSSVIRGWTACFPSVWTFKIISWTETRGG